MASLSLTASYTGHSIPANRPTSWTNTTGSSEWYVGRSGSTYCGKAAFTTPAYAAATSALSITCVCNQTSNPGYTRGYLMNRDMTPSQMLDGNGYGLEGVSGYLATLTNPLSSGNQSAGSSVTYTSGRALSLAPNTTYYIYFFRNGSSYNGFCAFRPNPTVSLTYTPATYVVSYNANSGTGAPGAQTKTHGSPLTLSSVKPTRSSASSTFTITGNGNGGTGKSVTATKTTSYTFAGWATSPSAAAGGSVAYAAGGSYTANAPVTLYAVWTASTSYSNNTVAALGSTSRPSASAGSYSVAFDANGGNSTPNTLYAARTTAYSFAGWGTTGSSGVNLSSGSAFYSNTTVYAQWGSSTSTAAVKLPAAITCNDGTSAGYTVSFDGNGGTPETGSLRAVNTVQYTFASWQGLAAGSSYTPTGNVTLTAWYNAKTVPGSITLPDASRKGYALLGWATDPAAESGVTGRYTPSGDATLYAVWEPSGLIHIYDGSAWRDGLVWVFDGTAWRQGLPWCYDGTIWLAGG